MHLRRGGERAGEKRGEGKRGREAAGCASAGSGRSPLNAIYVQVCVAMQTGHGSTDEHFFPMGRSQNKVDCLMTVMDGCVLHDNFKTGEEVEKSRELRSLSRVT